MLLNLVGSGGLPAVTPASAWRRLNYGRQPSPETKGVFDLVRLKAGVSAGRSKNEVEGKQEVRRRSTDAELWRTAFARETEDVLDLVPVWLACQP
jgi:hypothetical protein